MKPPFISSALGIILLAFGGIILLPIGVAVIDRDYRVDAALSYRLRRSFALRPASVAGTVVSPAISMR